MKTNTIISAALLSSVLAFTACTPRDGKISGQNNNSGGGGGGTTTTLGKTDLDTFKLGNFAMASFLAEKQIEAIELVKVATESTDATKAQFSVLTSSDKENGNKATELTSIRQLVQYPLVSKFNRNADPTVTLWTAFANKKIAVEYKKEALVESLTAAGTGVFSQVTDDTMTIAVRENTYSLVVTPTEDGQLNFVLTSEGYVMATQGDINDPAKPVAAKILNITVEMKLVVDKASLETSDVKIISNSSKVTFPGKGDDIYSASLTGADLNLHVDGSCNKLTGNLEMKTGDPRAKPVVMAITGDSITMTGKNWVHNFAECGKRQPVEIGRLIVF